MPRHEFKFVGKDEGAGALIEKLTSGAKGMAEEIVRGNVERSKSAKEAFQMSEEEIRQIQRKNKLHFDSRRMAEDRRHSESMGSGTLNDLQRKRETSRHREASNKISSDQKEDTGELSILKDILSQLKSSSSKSERASARSAGTASTERRMAGIREDAARGGDVMHDLANELDLEQGVSGGGRTGKRGRGRRGAGGAGIFDVAGDVAAQDTAGGAGMTMLGGAGKMLGKAFVPLAIAAAAGKIAQSVLTGSAERERLYQDAFSITGQRQDPNKYQGLAHGASKLGISREELAPLMVQIARMQGKAGSFDELNDKALGAAQTRNAMSIDMATVLKLVKVSRTLDDVDGQQGLAGKMFNALKGTGSLGANDKDMSRMEAMMQTFANVSEAQLMRGGATTSDSTMRAIGMLGKGKGVFRSDDFLNQTIQQMDSGIAGGMGTNAGAVKFQMLRELNPKMDAFDIETEMEKGLESKLLPSLMKLAKKIGGGDEEIEKRTLEGLMKGTNKAAVGQLVKQGLSVDGSPLGDGSNYNFTGKAQQVVGHGTERGIAMDEMFNDLKTSIGDGLTKGFDGIVAAFSKSTASVEASNELTRQAVNSIRESR